jgi:hypothetical protein
MIKLQQHEYIIACVPRYCAGPGWGNSLLDVYIVDGATGKMREELVGPERRTGEMCALFATLEAAHSAMRHEVEKMTKKAKVKK